jgi:phage-related protein
MRARGDWSIVFYREERGASPVREFLQDLDEEAQASLGWAIEQLRLRNVQAREPLVRHLEGKLWELRRESRTNIYRLIYFFASGQRIVFVHGFQKKTQKTPRQEIEIAHARLQRFTEREGGG